MSSTSMVEKIEKAALPLFARKGFEGTSLTQIAKSVGIKKPSLYAHFDSKEDLFLGMLQKVNSDYRDFLKERVQKNRNMKTEQQLYCLLKDNATYLKNEDLGLLFKRFMLFPSLKVNDTYNEQFIESEKALTEVLIEIVKEGKRIGDIQVKEEQVIDAYLCLLDGSFEQLFYYSEVEYEERLKNAWSIFWNGIKGC
ncbi:TetR/AcrR family transcriptional regulator [Guptibacillus algicola]|uniref:TetR/AcrR family transcriptional regulator n=1 Tax=Guptibacillus algicola TaxID=225844 RepID=UPI001CD1FCBF|nr:TetR/AcrR family transcriptional regulator [Alkalihalobacillus algicola]MCA0986561.1 TetR/AcrR family transcriptional regulator [Alkalihalobacillus algicola]